MFPFFPIRPADPNRRPRIFPAVRSLVFLTLFGSTSLVHASPVAEPEAGTFEILFGNTPADDPLKPAVGRYDVAEAEVVALPAYRGKSFLRLDGKRGRCEAVLKRPAVKGEHIRITFHARLVDGEDLRFGFAGGPGGMRVDGTFLAGIVSLLDEGKIGCFDGKGYRILNEKMERRDVSHKSGEWLDYVIDYVVGGDHFLFKAGKCQVNIPVLSDDSATEIIQVDRFMVWAGAKDTKAEIAQIAVQEETAAVTALLPDFGSIRWTRKEMPFIAPGPKGGVSGSGFVALNGKLYQLGGFAPAGDGTEAKEGRTSKLAYCYDPETDAWTRLPDLPARREYGFAAASGTTVYFFGGLKQGPSTASAEVYALDVSKKDLAWEKLPPISVARTHLAGEVVGDQLIVAGGNAYESEAYTEATIRDTVDILNLQDPSPGWKPGASVPKPARGWAGSASAGGKFYFFGGITFIPGKSGTKEFLRQRVCQTLAYDPEANTWTALAAPPLAVSGWRGALFKNRYVILIGGAAAEPPYISSYRWNAQPFVYDIEKDRWMRMSGSALPPGGVYNDSGVAIIGDRIYVAGGEAAGGGHYNTFLVGEIEPNPDFVTEASVQASPALVSP